MAAGSRLEGPDRQLEALREVDGDRGNGRLGGIAPALETMRSGKA
jgi:hypothetical protein